MVSSQASTGAHGEHVAAHMHLPAWCTLTCSFKSGHSFHVKSLNAGLKQSTSLWRSTSLSNWVMSAGITLYGCNVLSAN